MLTNSVTNLGYVKTYLVLPSMVYGIESGPLVDAGIVKPQSQQIPLLIKAGVARRRSGMVGKGKNMRPNVHIDDGEPLVSYFRERSH